MPWHQVQNTFIAGFGEDIIQVPPKPLSAPGELNCCATNHEVFDEGHGMTGMTGMTFFKLSSFTSSCNPVMSSEL